MVLRRPRWQEKLIPVYELFRDGGVTGRRTQIAANGYHGLCHAALLEDVLAQSPPASHDDLGSSCYELGGSTDVEVTLADGRVLQLRHGSAAYLELRKAWSYMASAVAWTDCAPPEPTKR
jgi:hypothetical protein